MSKKFSYPLLLLLLLTIVSSYKSTNYTVSNSSLIDPLDYDNYQHYFQDRIKLLCNNDLIFYHTVQAFYTQHTTPLWTANGYANPFTDSLLFYLKHSDQHGIPPQFFNYDSLFSHYEKNKSISIENKNYPDLYQFEIQLTKNYLLYAQSLTFGATDPTVVNGGKWLMQTKYADSAFVMQVLSNNIIEQLQQLQHQSPTYHLLQKELCKYLSLKDTLFDTIPVIEIAQGAIAPHVHLIGQRLLATKDIDSSYHPSDTLSKFLMTAINRFRSSRAIPISKKLDKETIDALNLQPQHYINKLSANLERYRWKIIPEKGESYIAVNMADFHLSIYHADSIKKVRICCGKSPAPKGKDTIRHHGILASHPNETPMMFGLISQIVLNPEWNIPPDIVKDEYYFKLVKDNIGTIHKEHIHVVDMRTKQEVNPDTLNWKKINRKNIPYRLYQISGAFNALGQIKFTFPNKESIYLHDTNNKHAFKRRYRALSHGCIRVENPFDLATQLLLINHYDEQKIEQVSIILGNKPTSPEGEKFLQEKEEKEKQYYENLNDEDKKFYRNLRPTYLYLKKKMPVYLEYFTCFISEDGIIQYRPDIYRKEQNIINTIQLSIQ